MVGKVLAASLLVAASFSMSACARNYAGEGALLGGAAGAGVGAISGGDIGEGAAIGAAAGAVGGALIKKDGRCYRRDRDGYEYRVRC